MSRIQIWQADLNAEAVHGAYYASLLSSDERIRADRMLDPICRDRFVVGRGILRELLGRSLGLSGNQLVFAYGAHGKPSLASPHNAGVEFNVSHSDGQALIAIAPVPIGVDLEKIRPVRHLNRLAARFFAPREVAAIAQVPIEHRSLLFFRYWTCKEAFLKATGDGLGKIRQLALQINPACLSDRSQPVILQQTPPDYDPQDWQLRELPLLHDASPSASNSPDGGYVGAVAIAQATIERPIQPLRFGLDSTFPLSP